MKEIICRHCGRKIKHHFGKLWHDDAPLFPQYCPDLESGFSSRLHEPDATVQTAQKELENDAK